MLICFLSMIDTEEDRDKFIMIYNKYKSLLFYVANNILADPSLSEDVVYKPLLRSLRTLTK